MKTNKIISISIIVLLCIILCVGTVSAKDNNTDSIIYSEDTIQGELQTTDNTNNEKLEFNRVGDYSYDNELEIQVENITISKIHREKFVLDKQGNDVSSSEINDFPEQEIIVRVVNLDYNDTDEWSIINPANLKINFNIYDENGKYLSNFTGVTDAYGYANFSSTKVPEKVGTYTITANYPGTQRYFSFGDGTHITTYYEYLPSEQTFIVKKLAPKEHKYTITFYWNGKKHTVDVKLSDSQYQSLKTAKKNKKTKEINGLHTKKYITVKKIITKKLVICKIKNNKKIWTKNWKSKNKKLVKQGYKAKRYKKISKKNGKIWITYKKTYTKKYEIKASVFTIAKNGQYSKGDYISLYAAEPMDAIKIIL